MTKDALMLYGTDEPAAEEIALAAGPLTALFVGGALRNIRLQDVEVVRGIYFLIRDRNWSTVVPEIRDLAVEQSEGAFKITFTAHGRTPSDGQELDWHGAIEGSGAKGISFAAWAKPESDFITCRTGFIVLHPLEKAVGCPLTIEHSDGSREETSFPDHIDPLQSFFDIRAMTHEPIAGVKATCRMEGGVWETEDHRNWLDASFKTYFRPLMLPWPYTVPAGEKIEQRVSLTFTPSVAKLAPVAAQALVSIAVGDRSGGVMPAIGLAVDADDADAPSSSVSRVASAKVQSLSVRLRSDAKDLPGKLRRALRLARGIGARPQLEIVLDGTNDPETALDLVAVAAKSAGFAPASVMVSPEIDLHSYPPSVDRPPGPALERIYEAARRAFPGIALGGGMYSYFTELNRRRVPHHLLDFVQHATASIVHAADDRSVMETLESLPHVFRSVRAFIGATPYRIGPANIGMAFNPYGKSTTPNPDNRRITMVTSDPRQTALFGAAWAAGYLARASGFGIDQVTMMSPGGPFGIADEGAPRPAFAVIRGFAELAGAAHIHTTSSHPQSVLAVSADRAGRRVTWLANLTPKPCTLAVAGMRPATLAMLDAASGGTLADRPLPKTSTLELTAYAVARLEA
ncbi:MAG: hypothetical protein AB7S92_09435 [Parvibaculaceae bacterium]